MKRQYEKPNAEYCVYASKDVLTVSAGDDNTGSWKTEWIGTGGGTI